MMLIGLKKNTHIRLMSLVTPLMTPDDVVNKLLDLANIPEIPNDSDQRGDQSSPEANRSPAEHPASPRKRIITTRAPRGASTDRRTYYRAVLAVLHESGGRQRVATIMDLVYDKVKDRLNETDLAPLPKNKKELRWQNHTRFARQWLVENGYLKANSEHGFWELTKLGEDCGRRLSANLGDRSVRF